MKLKYIAISLLTIAVLASCSRDEDSLFAKSAAQRAAEALDNANAILPSPELGWEMAYFPNLESDAKGYNMILKFKKDGSVSVTAKNAETTSNRILTDTASTWTVRSDYGPILSFDTYNDVFHAWADPATDGAGLLGDYEFLILKATPELILLKGKKHSAYSVMRPMKTNNDSAYFAACEQMQNRLFGNNNIVTLHKGNEQVYLYNGASGQFMSAEYGASLNVETATTHPVCATEDGIIVSTGFGDEVHEHIFAYDEEKGELLGESGSRIDAGNRNILFRSYFTDNARGWAVDTTSLDSIDAFVDQVNVLVKDTKKQTKINYIGYGYKQSLNMYEGGHFVTIQFDYKKKVNNKDKTYTIKLFWTVDVTADENGIEVTNLTAYNEQTKTWCKNLPIINSIVADMIGTFHATPLPTGLFNSTAGMYLDGNKQLLIKGANIKM